MHADGCRELCSQTMAAFLHSCNSTEASLTHLLESFPSSVSWVFFIQREHLVTVQHKSTTSRKGTSKQKQNKLISHCERNNFEKKLGPRSLPNLAGGGVENGEVLTWETQGSSCKGIPTGLKIGHNTPYITSGTSGLFTVFLLEK